MGEGKRREGRRDKEYTGASKGVRGSLCEQGILLQIEERQRFQSRCSKVED